MYIYIVENICTNMWKVQRCGSRRRKQRAPAHRGKDRGREGGRRKKNFSLRDFYKTIPYKTIKKKIWSLPTTTTTTAYSRARTVDSGCSAGPAMPATPSACHPPGNPDDSSPGSCGTSTSYLQRSQLVGHIYNNSI